MMSSESMAAFAAAAEQPDYEEPEPPPTRPILFSGPMVRAILDGRKTQTRRVVKSQPDRRADRVGWNTAVEAFRQWAPGYGSESGGFRCGPDLICPYGQLGDWLWVRETWGYDWFDNGQGRAHKRVIYRADDDLAQPQDQGEPMPWRPSIHMPRMYSRLTLKITEVRVERLQAITNVEAEKEGVTHYDCGHPDCFDKEGTPGKHFGPRAAFMELWNKLNAKRGYGWRVNPWVWVIAFRRVAS